MKVIELVGRQREFMDLYNEFNKILSETDEDLFIVMKTKKLFEKRFLEIDQLCKENKIRRNRKW